MDSREFEDQSGGEFKVQETTGEQVKPYSKDQFVERQTPKNKECSALQSSESTRVGPRGTATDSTIRHSVPHENETDYTDYNSMDKRSNTPELADEKASGTDQSTICNTIREGFESGNYELPEGTEQQLTEQARMPTSYRFPPAVLPQYRSRHRARFDRTCLLPDRNLPFTAQVMEHVKDWAELGSRIEDDQRRKEVLDRAFETLTSVWYEALRVGYDPGHGEPTRKGPKSAQRTSTTMASSKTKKENGPGRPPGVTGKSRQKSPSRAPLFVSRSHKDGPHWAITSGELEEAHISEERIRQRAASGGLQGGDKLLEEVLESRGGTISRDDWCKVTKTTRLNPWGRNLLIYSLYEVQKSRQSIARLDQLYAHFSHTRQKENTQRRIDEEKARHNLFMALALEINDQISSSRSCTPPREEAEAEKKVLDSAQDSSVTNLDSRTEVIGAASPPLSSEAQMQAVETLCPQKSQISSTNDNTLKRALPDEDLDIVDGELSPTKRQKTRQDRQMDDQSLAGFSSDWEDQERKADTSAKEDQLEPGPSRVQESVKPGNSAMGPERRSLIVKLPTSSTFDPVELSSNTVFSHKGFKYRYTRYSTLAQRKSMDEVLDTYVRERIRPQPLSRAEWRPEFRFGKYEVLTHPDDPERTSIIHGFWDQKDGSQAQGAEWFYQGDGDMEPTWQYEPSTTAQENDDSDSGSGRGRILEGTTPTSSSSAVNVDVDMKVNAHAPSTATSPVQVQGNVPVNKHLKNVLRLKRSSEKWTLDKSNTSTIKGMSEPKAKKRVSGKGVLSPSPLSQSMTTTTRSSSRSAERPKRQKTMVKYVEEEEDSDYEPAD